MLAGIGYRAAFTSRDATKLVVDSPPDQGAVAPTKFGEQARNPIFGGTLAIRELTNGFGRMRMHDDPDGRYLYGLNFDPSAGPWLKGPDVTSVTPATRDSTNGINRFFEIGGQIFALNGRYVLDGNNNGTTWATTGQGNDFGSGNAAVDVTVVQANDGTSSRYAWIGMGDSVAMYYFDGTTYTQTSGANVMYARAFAVDGTNLYRFDDTNRMWQCDLLLDPRTAANWPSATDRIGTKDYPVTRATVDHNGALAILKGDDVYTLNIDGTVNRLFQHEQLVASTLNGQALASWRGPDDQPALYTVYGNGTFALTPSGGLIPIGPELLPENESPVKGQITAMVGTDHALYAGIYNQDTGNSYLMKFTGRVFKDEYGTTIPAWHGSITAAFSSKKITALYASSIGATSLHKRLYMGFSDGTIAHFTLPCTANPSACTAYTFSTATASVYLGRLFFYFSSASKLVLAATGEGEGLTSTNYASLQYRTQSDASYATLTQSFNTDPSRQVDMPDNVSCVYFDPLVTLESNSSSTSPKITGLSFLWRLRDPPLKVVQANLIAEDGLRARDGTPYLRSGQDIARAIGVLERDATATEFIEPDGTSRTVTVSAPRRITAYDEGIPRRPRDAIQVILTETRSQAGGISFANASAYGGAATFAFESGSGSNRLILVGIYQADGTSDLVSGVTYAGVAMTRIATTTSSSVRIYLYYLVAPATGSNNVVVSTSSVNSAFLAVSYAGVHQSAPIHYSTTASSSTLTGSVSITGAWLAALFGNDSGASITAAVSPAVGRTPAAGARMLDSNSVVDAGSPTITGTNATFGILAALTPAT